MKVSELRKLPVRKWDDVKAYHSICVINSRKKHDSGWALMQIIGLDKNRKPIEIAAHCDDINWYIPSEAGLRNDMFYPSGVIHFWSNRCYFMVGSCTPSTDVKLVPKKQQL